MTGETAVTMEQWRKLYEAAERFKALAPWEWLWDSKIFGVADPVSGEVGYCCVMGRNGTFYALGAYLGAQGLDAYEFMRRDKNRDPMASLMMSRHLMASFESRNDLEKEDMAVVRALGRKYRGHDDWPKFRSQSPGMFPWFLTVAEAEYLTVVLLQAIEVCGRIRDDGELIGDFGRKSRATRLCLVRVCGEDGVWRDMQRPFDPPVQRRGEPVIVDEMRLARLLRKDKQQDGIFEGDLTHMPEPCQDGDERPYFPRTVMWVEVASLLAIPTDLVSPGASDDAVFAEGLWRLLEQSPVIPLRLVLKQPRFVDVIAPLTEKLGIEVRVESQLPHWRQVMQEMSRMMGMRERR